MRANSAIFMYFYTAYGFLLKIEINTTSKHDRKREVVFASFFTVSLTILQSNGPFSLDQTATIYKLEEILQISFESKTLHDFPFVRHSRLFKIMNTIVKKIDF